MAIIDSKMDNILIIENFYKALAEQDAEKMAIYYSADIAFEDPIFGKLKGNDVILMWKMLMRRANGNLKVNYSNIIEDGNGASGSWVAQYPFGKTGRMVTNKIFSKFVIENGVIVKHIDDFSVWKWSAQALGMPGVLLGWTSKMKYKVRKVTLGYLHQFKQEQA